MRYFTTDEYSQKELMSLNPENWMVDLLKLNPPYCSWGPGEDAMYSEDGGWSGSLYFNSWGEFGPWNLNDLNELVNFYFSIERNTETCNECDGTGYNKETKKLYDSWYGKPTYRDGWINNLTDDEVKMLWENNRLFNYKQCPTAKEFNSNRKNSILLDSISCHMCVEFRAKRNGVYGLCKKCNGVGYTYTEPTSHLDLTLWILHPRKGCSRGVRVKNIQKDNLAEVMSYLLKARDRNNERFSKINIELY